MAELGQIIYEVEGLKENCTASTKADLSGLIYSDDKQYENNRINILENVFGRINGIIGKLGIQAPRGTKFTLNENKKMIVGRSGIYELDTEVNITSLKFEESDVPFKNIIIDYAVK